MRTMKLGKTNLTVPVIGVGCMRITELDRGGAERFLASALEQGANFFDHADIYGDGVCEEKFARAIGMSPAVREKIILQSKCGIVRGKMYDFSKEHILESVDGSLRRLNTDYLDVLLLHRPDTLMEPEEVAEAFNELKEAGKVRHFGVSNFNPTQIQLLQKSLKQPIAANQLQFSAAHTPMVDEGFNVNLFNDGAVGRTGGVLEFCRLYDVTIQPWSPFQSGFFGGTFFGDPKYAELNRVLSALAEKYLVTPTTIAIAWILRHPAGMQPIVGTMNSGRLKAVCKAADVTLTREEWYEVYRAAGNKLP